jgi:hypothetical protein
VQASATGFTLIRREVFEAIRKASGRFFAPPEEFIGTPASDEGVWFCEQVQAAGMKIVADTAIRLWKVGASRLGWENAGGEIQRHEDYTFFLPNPGQVEFIKADPELAPIFPAPRPHPPRSFRPEATPLAKDFPKIKAFIVTYPANRDSLALTLASIQESDWAVDPIIIDQPPEWTPGGPSAPANYKRALEAAKESDCDFALILEDDVRVSKHLRHNLLTLPLVRRDQCDYLSLFVPDLLGDPWERHETPLGYRVAKARYGGPDRLWEKHRVWGVQAILFSRRLLLETLSRWDRLQGVQDARVMGVCGELGVPLYYSSPCWVDHAPLRSGYNTPLAYAPDFAPDFKLRIEPGFQPPENIPGWLTRGEAELLWRFAAGRDVLEIGVGCGQKTVCLAQSARSVHAIDATDPAESAEWVARYGLNRRVSFEMTGQFELLILAARDSVGLKRDLNKGLLSLEKGRLVAVHHYPDPAWPEVRAVIDAWSWKRIAQVDYLGIFQS